MKLLIIDVETIKIFLKPIERNAFFKMYLFKKE